VELSIEERLHGGLDDFYAQEAEMERQLGTSTKTVWLDWWKVPDEPAESQGPDDPGYDPLSQPPTRATWARWNQRLPAP